MINFLATFLSFTFLFTETVAYHWDSSTYSWQEGFIQEYPRDPIICGGEDGDINTTPDCFCMPKVDAFTCPDTSLTNEYLWFRGLETSGFEELIWKHNHQLGRFSNSDAFISMFLQISRYTEPQLFQNASLSVTMNDYVFINIDMTNDRYLLPKRYVAQISRHWIEYFTLKMTWKYDVAPFQNNSNSKKATSDLFIYELAFFV